MRQHLRRYKSSSAISVPNFDDVWNGGMALRQVHDTFNGAFNLEFPDAATRGAMITAMAASYGRRLLQERLAASPSSAAAIERLRDPVHLPTREEVLTAFGIEHEASPAPAPAHSRAATAARADLALLARIAEAPAASRSFEDNVRLECGAHTPLSALSAFCEEQEEQQCAVPELLTAEHVRAVTAYLAANHAALPPALCDRPVLVLGSDRLAHFIAREWGGGSSSGGQPVITTALNGAAVTQQQPALVLGWWLPAGIDLTAAWRAVQTVHEYVLVGPTDGAEGAAGLPWETWGHASPNLPEGFLPSELEDLALPGDDAAAQAAWQVRRSLQTAHEAVGRGLPPPHAEDGFERQSLDGARFQVCAGDSSNVPCGRSDTVSFRRNA